MNSNASKNWCSPFEDLGALKTRLASLPDRGWQWGSGALRKNKAMWLCISSIEFFSSISTYFNIDNSRGFLTSQVLKDSAPWRCPNISRCDSAFPPIDFCHRRRWKASRGSWVLAAMLSRHRHSRAMQSMSFFFSTYLFKLRCLACVSSLNVQSLIPNWELRKELATQFGNVAQMQSQMQNLDGSFVRIGVRPCLRLVFLRLSIAQVSMVSMVSMPGACLSHHKPPVQRSDGDCHWAHSSYGAFAANERRKPPHLADLRYSAIVCYWQFADYQCIIVTLWLSD